MKKVLLFVLTISLVLGLCACGSSGGNPQEAASEEPKAVIKVGLMTGYQPYEYFDENDVAQGFDVDVITEALTRLGYKVEFTGYAWEGLLPALEAGYVDLVSCQLARTDSRINQYYMATTPYFEGGGTLVVKSDNSTVKNLDDLAASGEAIGVTVGDAWTAILETYNEENGDVLNLQYYSEDISTVLEDIVNGRIAATLNEPSVIKERGDVLGILDDLNILDDTLYGNYFASYAFQRTDEGFDLRAELDSVIKEMLEDGTISDLSVKYFGADFTANCLDNIDTRDEIAD